MSTHNDAGGTAISILLTGTRVFTANAEAPWADTLLVDRATITFAGGEAEARDCAPTPVEEIHLPGALAVPGMIDSHIHLTWGAHALTILNLEEVDTPSELAERLQAWGETHPRRPWLQGYGLRYHVLESLDRTPREVLDGAVADRPVFIRSYDYHTAWCNGEALRQAGIERGRELLPPNEVVIDAATGLATGTLRERGAHGLVARLIPDATSGELDDQLAAAMRHLNSLGITAVHNMDGNEERLTRYRRLQEQGRQTVRAAHYLTFRPQDSVRRVHEIAALAQSHNDDWNRVPGLKLYLDGVIEGKTALLFQPYAGGSDEGGAPDIDLRKYRRVIAAANAAGLGVATHAIGDRAVSIALDAYGAGRDAEAAQAGGGRHRIEHIELIRDADIRRYSAALDRCLTASMQPLHAIPAGDGPDNVWSRNVGPERERNAFPWRRLRDAGARLCFGSDWPIVTPDPRAGLRAAVTRTDPSGRPAGGWHPEQCVTLAEAIAAYTRDGACAVSASPVTGQIRAGHRADLTIFAEDLFRLGPDEWTDVPIALTMVGGRVVYRSR